MSDMEAWNFKERTKEEKARDFFIDEWSKNKAFRTYEDLEESLNTVNNVFNFESKRKGW